MQHCHLSVGTQIIRLFNQYHIPSESASEVDGTTHGLEQRETANGAQCGVVGDLEATSDLGELRHGDVGQFIVADNGKTRTQRGEIGRDQGLEFVAVEAQSAIDRCQRWNRDGHSVTDGHVVGPHHVGERHGQLCTVGAHGQALRNVAELHANLVEVRVVDNGDGVGRLQVDAVQRVELGVVDGEHGNFLQACGESQALEGGESFPQNRVDRAQHGKIERGENSETVQEELTSNRGEAVSRQLRHLCHIVGNQVPCDLLDAI